MTGPGGVDETRRWWQAPPKIVTKYVQQPDTYSGLYSNVVANVRAELDEHQPHVSGADAGCGDYARDLWCSECRSPWPCRSVRFLVNLLGSEVHERWSSDA